MKSVKYILYILFFIFLFNLSGCRTFYDLAVNIGMQLSKPDKIKNKIKEPVKDGVKLSALWVGHCTVLVQIEDKVILFDPFFTNNAAEIQRRVQEPGLDLNDLKKLDIIFVSHAHFDHLSIGSLKILEEKFPGTKLVFPEGVEEFLPKINFNLKKLKQPDYKNNVYVGETRVIDSMKITSVAAFHWGGRYGLDGLIWDYKGYAGFIIQYKDITVYFSGDTSYDEKFFKYLGNKYSIDIAFIPIGPCIDCYETGKPGRHLFPGGVFSVLDDTKTKVLVPIHFGTLYEKSEPFEPIRVLKELMEKQPQYSDRIKILEIGEQVIFK